MEGFCMFCRNFELSRWVGLSGYGIIAGQEGVNGSKKTGELMCRAMNRRGEENDKNEVDRDNEI